MKKGLSLAIALSLMLTSFGCFVEHRGEGYRGHEENREHREYRDHEEHKDGRYDGDRHDERDQDRDENYREQH